jgi:hypothetical protein
MIGRDDIASNPGHNWLLLESRPQQGYQIAMTRRGIPLFLVALVIASGASAQGAHDALVAKHAAANAVPESLVRRVIRIESRGNPRAVSKGNYGLMQIRLGTARALGYTGTVQGLLDPDTNMTFAVKYLAGAYRAAGCDANRAIAYYQRGYHGAARSRCRSPQPSPIVLAGQSSGAAASAQPLEKAKLEGAAARQVATSVPEPVTTQSADILKPRVVQTVAISRSKYEPFPVARVARSEPETVALPLPRARPNPAHRASPSQSKNQAKATQVIAVREPATTVQPPLPKANPIAAPAQSNSGSKQGPDAIEVLAAREPEAVPLPRVKQPHLQPATGQQAQPVHSSQRNRARASKSAGAPFDLLSFIKKIVTPETKKPPTRKRRSQAQL